MIQSYTDEQPPLPINDADHHSILALLPDFVMERVLGYALSNDWDGFQRHLAGCPHCRDEADALTALMAESYAGPLPGTPVPAAPNVRFLHIRPPSAGEIQLSLTIRPPPAIVERRTRGNICYEYTQHQSHPLNMDLTIQALTIDEASDRGLLRIMIDQDVDNPMDQPPLRVTHRAGGVVRETLTDPRGIASFENVPLDDIVDWEISISLLEG